MSLREGSREPHLLFPAQAWPLLLTLTDFYLMKVPFQIFSKLTVPKTKMHGNAAVKYLKLSTALTLKCSVILLVEEHFGQRNKMQGRPFKNPSLFLRHAYLGKTYLTVKEILIIVVNLKAPSEFPLLLLKN